MPPLFSFKNLPRQGAMVIPLFILSWHKSPCLSEPPINRSAERIVLQFITYSPKFNQQNGHRIKLSMSVLLSRFSGISLSYYAFAEIRLYSFNKNNPPEKRLPITAATGRAAPTALFIGCVSTLNGAWT